MNSNRTETFEKDTPEIDAPQESFAAAFIPFSIAFVLIAAGIFVFVAWKNRESEPVENFNEVIVPTNFKVEAFELEERSGKPFKSQEMLGDVWVASFFFSTCPGPCTRLNASIANMQNDPSLHDVKWLSITVDPVNDSVPVLKEYADRFQADPERWFFCRADYSYTKQVAEQVFKLPVSYQHHYNYGVVIGRDGKLRAMLDINSARDREKLKKVLIDCLAEPKESPSESKTPAKAELKEDLQ